MGTPREDEWADPIAGLPPEWGALYLPDDASELAQLTRSVRRELRWARRRKRLGATALFRTPFVILGLTLLLALSSLFAITGVTEHTQPETGPFTDLTLADEQGQRIRLAGHLPAVLLLLDGCACAALRTAVAASVPVGVSVLLVGKLAPAGEGAALRLADPSDQVRKLSDAGPAIADQATVLLINAKGRVTRLVRSGSSVEEFRADLPALLA